MMSIDTEIKDHIKTSQMPLLVSGPAGSGKREATQRAVSEVLQVCTDQLSAHPDCIWIAPSEDKDQAVLSVDVVRQGILRSKLSADHGVRVLIIERLDRATWAAMDAALKILEESPPRLRIVGTVDALPDIPATIRSRCAISRVSLLGRSTGEKKLLELRPNLDKTRAHELLQLTGNSPGHAAIAADNEADLCRREFIAAVKDDKFGRLYIAQFVDRWKSAWPAARQAIDSVARDVMRVACGNGVGKDAPQGTQMLGKQFDPMAAAQLYDAVRKRIRVADEKYLDAATTLERLARCFR